MSVMERWEAVFPDQPGPRRNQVSVLASLLGHGKLAVDIGVWIGYSAIAMRLAGAEVIGIDSYVPHHGWADESYNGDADLEEFRANCARAKVFVPIWRMEAAGAAHWWNQGLVDLVHWDLDLGHTIEEDFWAWDRHVAHGGWFVFHDLPGQAFGSGPIIRRAVESGRWRNPQAWVEANLWGMVKA